MTTPEEKRLKYSATVTFTVYVEFSASEETSTAMLEMLASEKAGDVLFEKGPDDINIEDLEEIEA